MKIRVVAAQPLSVIGASEGKNATDSVRWIRRAAQSSAALVVFPEGYPGPINAVNSHDAFGLVKAAASTGIGRIGMFLDRLNVLRERDVKIEFPKRYATISWAAALAAA